MRLFALIGDSISNLFQKVKDQPLEETVGDALQFLSRKLVQTSAVIVTALGITTVAEAGLAVAAGVGGTIAAKKLLEPFVINIVADGTAVLDKAVSSGVSVCQAVETSLSQAVQNLCGLSDAANNLCFAMQGAGNGGRDTERVGSRDAIKLEYSEIEFEFEQLQSKYKHAKKFGLMESWNKHAVYRYKKVLTDFINAEDTEVMQALYRKEPAIFYINKKTRLFVVEVGGKYCTGWKLGEAQLEAFLKSGNLN